MRGGGGFEPPPLDSPRKLLSWTLERLRILGHRPSKRLGQHFLVNPRVVLDYKSALGGRVESLLELGAGLGVLTYHLASVADRLVAVEIDERLAKSLLDFIPGNVAVVVGDAVSIVESYCVKAAASNTPFEASTAIIASTARNNCIEEAVYVVQREVASRLVARPGSRGYGRLSILARRFFDVKILSVYPPRYFHPEPEVYSAMVVLRRTRRWTHWDDVVEEFTRCLFSSRRKLARRVALKCLESLGYSTGGASLDWLGERRVSQLSPEDLERILREALGGSGCSTPT